MHRLLPAALRRRLRLAFDSLFCPANLGLERIGGDAAWWIAPALLKRDSCILSGGAGNDISFELALADRFGCRIALFDPSPTGRVTLERSKLHNVRLDFFPVGLSGKSGRVLFAAPRDMAEGSFTTVESGATEKIEFECLSAPDALGRAGFSAVDLLKIDIEGFEYGFLESLLATAHRPAQIAAEFHHFLPHIPLRRTWATIRALRQADYRIVHKEQCDFLFIHKSALVRLRR